MNKIGLHFGYMRGTPYESDIFQAIPVVCSAGAEILEIPVGYIFPLNQAERSRLKAMAADNGLTLTMTGSMDDKTDIASDDPEIRAEGEIFACQVLQAASDIGASTWGGVNYQAWLGRPRQLLTAAEKERIRDLSLVSLRRIIKTAEDLGIDYCFEIVNRFEGFLLNTAEEGLRYVQDVGSERAKILLDTYHMNIEEDSIVDAMDMVQQAGCLGHFHVGESNRRIPGTGKTHMPWDDIFDSLKRNRYGGTIVMEPFVRMGLPSSMNTCTWRQLTANTCFEEYMRDVTTGVSYIQSHLK